MKIKPKLCLTKQPQIVAISCNKTGINSAIAMPEIPGKVFEWIHPLAYWSNVKGVLEQGRKYLEQLDSNVLAGLVITTYEHFRLLDKYELSAQEANSILMTASNDTLVEALAIARNFTEQNTVGTPSLTMEWKEIKDHQTIDRQVGEYLKRIRAEFIKPELGPEEARMARITVLNKQSLDRRLSSGVIALGSGKQTLSDCEREWEESFKGNKKEAKQLLEALKMEGPKLPHLTPAFFEYLGKCLPGRLLVIMSQKLRTDICTRLRASQSNTAEKLAGIIEACHNPYDIFAKVDDSLDRASDSFRKQEKPRTIAEILAEKRKSQVVATTREQVEELFAAQQAVGHHVTNPQDTDLLNEEDDSDLEEVDQMMSRTEGGIYDSEDF